MSGYHLAGHRIDDIHFSRREVTCECGLVFTVEDSESVVARDEALAEAFREHRRAMGASQAEAPRWNKSKSVAPGKFMR